ncbi:hypothetical protein Gorai_010837, partial [Gossypium raimondii]|nr:hypothetical protein [Gossypium raimondii]
DVSCAKCDSILKTAYHILRVPLRGSDGAVRASTRLASIGTLLRNVVGVWVQGFKVMIGVIDDALWVMNILSRPFKANHLLGTLMNDCLVPILKDWAMDVRHILWKGNQCADHLANLAQAEASASVY